MGVRLSAPDLPSASPQPASLLLLLLLPSIAGAIISLSRDARFPVFPVVRVVVVVLETEATADADPTPATLMQPLLLLLLLLLLSFSSCCLSRAAVPRS